MNAMNTQVLQNDLSETITVAAKPEAVFAAINNVRGWWSGIIEGESGAVGHSFSYRYKDIHESTQQVIEQVPGTMMFLGGTPLDRSLATAAPNHSNRVYFDESAMVDGTAMYAAVALRHLGLS